jgi:hypothetical protein
MPAAAPAVYPHCPVAAREAADAGQPLRPTRWTAWDGLWAILGAVVLGNLAVVAVLLAGLPIEGPLVLVLVAIPWVALGGWPLWATQA